MEFNKERSYKMRVIHRYLGFFLAGIMAVYAISGISLIFRDSDILKKTVNYDLTIDTDVAPSDLAKELNIRKLKIAKTEDNISYFKEGTYNSSTGQAHYTLKETPYVLDKLQHLHKAKTSDPLFFLNIFFGLGLLFFVISSFWMFAPSSSIFKKGMYFTLGGILLTLLLLFV